MLKQVYFMKNLLSLDTLIGSGSFIVFIIFLILKLTRVVAWSWWWVTAPLWAPFIVVFGVCFGFMLFWYFFLVICILLDIFDDLFHK